MFLGVRRPAGSQAPGRAEYTRFHTAYLVHQVPEETTCNVHYADRSRSLVQGEIDGLFILARRKKAPQKAA